MSSKVENEDSLALSSLVADISLLGSILFSSVVGLDSSITKCVVSSMVPFEIGLVTIDSTIGGGEFSGVLLILVSDS